MTIKEVKDMVLIPERTCSQDCCTGYTLNLGNCYISPQSLIISFEGYDQWSLKPKVYFLKDIQFGLGMNRSRIPLMNVGGVVSNNAVLDLDRGVVLYTSLIPVNKVSCTYMYEDMDKIMKEDNNKSIDYRDLCLDNTEDEKEDIKCPGGSECMHTPKCTVFSFNVEKGINVYSDNEKCDPGNRSIYGKEERCDRPQQALDDVINTIEECTEELKAITFLEHRSRNGFKYFNNVWHDRMGLTQRKNELYRIIAVMIEELKERVL